MTTEPNIGQAFPLEKLASDIARSEYNYQAILNGLILWDKSTADEITIRLTKDTTPFFQEYTIKTRTFLASLNTPKIEINNHGLGSPLREKYLDIILFGGSYVPNLSTPDANDYKPNRANLGNLVTFTIQVINNPGDVLWSLYYLPLVTLWSQNKEFRYPNIVRDPSLMGPTDPLFRAKVPFVPVNLDVYLPPNLDSVNYEPIDADSVIPMLIPTVGAFTSSMVAQYTLPQDISAFLLRAEAGPAVNETNILVKVTFKEQ